MTFRFTPVAFAAAVAFATATARAADAPPMPTAVSLSSSASADVTRDLLSMTFSTLREGLDAAAVQSQLKQALDAALAEAKKAVRPGQVEVQTGNFTLTPRYTDKGVVSGWRGSVELIVEGRDMQAIGQLSGRITTLSIARVAHNLSREARERAEGEVAAQAIARYRAKAADYAKHFGFAGYSIREVNVLANDMAPPVRPMAAMQMRAGALASDEALAIEPGKGTVTVSVNGTVLLK